MAKDKKKILLVVSDLHLGAGSFFEDGDRNYREDFFHDFKFVEFLEFYRVGKKIFPVILPTTTAHYSPKAWEEY